jgi:hypothetical protein
MLFLLGAEHFFEELFFFGEEHFFEGLFFDGLFLTDFFAILYSNREKY